MNAASDLVLNQINQALLIKFAVDKWRYQRGQRAMKTFHGPSLCGSFGELEKFEISFKIEARKRILPQAYT
ncbi:hypothetical protein DPPLL_35370 [Desulfofustis limnaeus]|uniref:Transposase n=1 Tax=Desulfofustis limnaeus TaxID=2740163 RepID=A0ABM7WDW0_9BACT|nr:hypothetical protein DPPLL_35370 [Desulfofustis limnaeus]